jgi:glyoxylase-like metal-dependent hydrolase (beta-lactamase superfamily II)
MKIHAIQTGITRIKPEFQRGNAQRGLISTLFSTLYDKPEIDLPIFAWLIEHEEGLILVDTGESSKTTVTPVAYMAVKQEDELAVHTDHIGGITPFRDVPTYVSEHDHQVLSNFIKRRLSSLFDPIPNWFNSRPVTFSDIPFGTFPNTAKITQKGDILAIPTPGHTAGHLSVIVIDKDVEFMIAGDVTYSEQSLLNRQLQGISFAKSQHLPTIDKVCRHVKEHPTVYLPTHDPESGFRLAQRKITENYLMPC